MAKEMADETREEYIRQQQKSKAQEAALRNVNQKLADKAMDVCEVYSITVHLPCQTLRNNINYVYKHPGHGVVALFLIYTLE